MTDRCPVCSSEEAEDYPYDNHTRRLTAAVFKHALGRMVFNLGIRTNWLRRRLLFGPSSKVRRCTKCGHGHYQHVFQEGELEDYYRHRYFLAPGLERDRWDDAHYCTGHAKTRGQWAFVKPHLEPLASIQMLDVGAAASRISRVAKMHFGDRVQCSVVEPGEGWIEYYRHHHIRLAGRFFPIGGDETWDYIHTSHWLEHVDKLNLVIKGLRSSLRKGGLCFIEVPNCDLAYFTHDFPDQPHVHFFTAASLRQAMQTHGFVAVDVRECAMANAAYLNYRRRPEAVPAEERRLAQESEASIEPVASGNLLRGLFRAE